MEALEGHLQRQIEHSRRFFWHRLRWRLVREHLPSAEPFELIDVGAGAGLLGDFLARDMPLARYRFVEPLRSLETYLEDRFGPDANAGHDARFNGARFVCLFDVLEHQAADEEFLSDLAAKMNPGATLLLTVPALMGLWSEWDVSLGHYRRYDLHNLRACGERSGLIVREVSYLFPELIPAALVRRLRNPAKHQEEGPGASAEFPDLPRWLNGLLYLLGRPSVRLRRFAPFGSSAFALLKKP
jgi:hypothetical protein